MMGQRKFDYYAASIPDKYMLLTLTIALAGIVAVVKWDALFPDRLNYANLAPLPTGARRIFLAKFIALMLFVGLFVLVLNAASTVLFCICCDGQRKKRSIVASIRLGSCGRHSFRKFLHVLFLLCAHGIVDDVAAFPPISANLY